MTPNCTNCGAMLISGTTVCPVCRQPVASTQKEASWPPPAMQAGAAWQQPQPYVPQTAATDANKTARAVVLVAICLVLLLLLGGMAGALFYFKSRKSQVTTKREVVDVPVYGDPVSNSSVPDEPPPPPDTRTTNSTRGSISGGVLNGKATSLPKPVYPAIAKAARATGTVIVQVTVDERGTVISARAISGHPLLQAAAVQAAYEARFSPTKLAGQPVKVTGTLNYNFVGGSN